MSSNPTYAPTAEPTTRPAGNALVAAAVLGLFVLAAILGAMRKDITQGFDELAHVSYIAHIQQSGTAWPDLETMRLLDPRSFRFTDTANYLNHPPNFYALLAMLGPTLVGHPQALLVYRLIDVAIASAGFAALLGLALPWPRAEFGAFVVPVACIPVLTPIAGTVTNDNLAFCGGALALLGVWQCLVGGRDRWLALALFGVLAAGSAKLTALLLTAPMVGGVVVYMLWRRRLRWTWVLAVALVFLLAATPYVEFIWHYGSPAPETPAQLALITDGAHAAGWSELPRKYLPDYLVYFVGAFVAEWIPTLGARSVLDDTMLIVPVSALGCGLLGLALSLRRLRHRRETPLDVIVIAGAVAIAMTLAIHVGFSYGRYAATGWLMDAYPRYYLPLAAIVPLAGLSLVAAIDAPRRRAALLALLIAGPVAARIFVALLG